MDTYTIITPFTESLLRELSDLPLSADSGKGFMFAPHSRSNGFGKSTVLIEEHNEQPFFEHPSPTAHSLNVNIGYNDSLSTIVGATPLHCSYAAVFEQPVGVAVPVLPLPESYHGSHVGLMSLVARSDVLPRAFSYRSRVSPVEEVDLGYGELLLTGADMSLGLNARHTLNRKTPAAGRFLYLALAPD